MNPALSCIAGPLRCRKSGVNPAAKAVFITGTDTGIGKTVIAGCLARYLSQKGHDVITQKWIQTGCDSLGSSDIAAHLKVMGRKPAAIKGYLPYAAPYIFKPASSPHLACKTENKRISADKVINSFKFLSERFDFIIVEGTGGALVPFTKKRLVIDIVRELDLPVVIVAGNKLGAINHTILTIEALRARKIKILGLIFNDMEKKNSPVLEDNPRIIEALTGQKSFGRLPWEPARKKLYQEFIPIGERISRRL